MNLDAEIERGIGLPVQFYPMFETAIRSSIGPIGRRTSGSPRTAVRRTQRDRCEEPVRLDPRRKDRRGDHHGVRTQPDDRAALPEAAQLEQQRRHGCRGDHVLGRCRSPAGRPRRPLGVPPRGHRLPRHQSGVNGPTCSTLAGDPDRRRSRLELAGVTVDDLAHRPLLVFPLGRPDRRQRARDPPGPPADRHRWPHLRGRAVQQLRHALHRHHGRRSTRTTRVSTGWCTANGGFITKHAFGVYSTTPTARFRHDKPQAQIDALPRRELARTGRRCGTATVEAYTVMFDRDGAPEPAISTCCSRTGAERGGPPRPAM